MTPVEAADVTLYARETVKDIAYQHGLVATFFPDPFVDDTNPKNGQHIHVSANPIKETSKFDNDRFLGGLLSHMPALVAIGMPNVDSYSRSGEGHYSTGAFVSWGDNNRESTVRRLSGNHWEVRCNDATSNIYAMIAGILGAGLDHRPLTMKGLSSKLAFPIHPFEAPLGIWISC